MRPALLATMARSAMGMSFVAALSVATATTEAQSVIGDELTEEVVAPSCPIGSLQSWQGRPCVISERGHIGERNGG